MNAILQKRIEEAAKQCATTTDGKIISFAYLAAKQMADWLLQNQWISTDESLPPCHDDDVISDVSIRVIACTSEGVIRYAYYHHYLQQWFSVETSTMIDNVTKWMSVPEEGGE